MFDLGSGTVGSVNVMTSQQGGLTNEQIADLAVDKIASISDQAPPHVRQQAKIFKEHLKNVLYHYILLARREERASIIQVLRSSGQKETAEYIRRL
jgi:hypothetical protein|tara:strand:+ start:3138 stop:3425 length:288 start_codon:yes stop_codon:yes gene_type:complete